MPDPNQWLLDLLNNTINPTLAGLFPPKQETVHEEAMRLFKHTLDPMNGNPSPEQMNTAGELYGTIFEQVQGRRSGGAFATNLGFNEIFPGANFGDLPSYLQNSVFKFLTELGGPGGGGAAGRVQFASEAERDLASALLDRVQAQLLPQQFGLAQNQFSLEEELGRGRLALDQLLAGLQSRGLDLERELGFAQIDISGRSLDETIRANRAAERSAERERALQAAQAISDNYARAAELADARRATAMAETRLLAPQILPPGSTSYPGFGPGDPLAQAFGNFGLPFTPPPVHTIGVDPGSLVAPPTQEQIGTIPGQDILNQMMGQDLTNATSNQPV